MTRRAVSVVAGLVLMAWTLLPIYWLANLSLMNGMQVLSRQLVVDPPTIENYVRITGNPYVDSSGTLLPASGYAPQVMAGLFNSLVVALAVLCLTMILATPLAYALGKLSFRGRRSLLLTIISSRLYPPIATAIPLLALYHSFGILGTHVGLVLAHLTITLPLATWVLTSFFRQLPRELESLARTDGCGRWETIGRVMVPIARPALVAVGVIAFFTSWNDFTMGTILAAGYPAQTLAPSLASMFFHVSEPNWMAAGAVLGLVPPAVLALVFQRHIQSLNLVGA